MGILSFLTKLFKKTPKTELPVTIAPEFVEAKKVVVEEVAESKPVKKTAKPKAESAVKKRVTKSEK
jgi:hypothetical protein